MTTRERYARVKSLLASALELPDAERDAFVAREAGDDAALAAELRELLEIDRAPRQFLDPEGAGDVVERDLEVGQRIGRYTLQRKIGEGGMGVVYEALQENPRRTVALKVLRHDSMSADNLRRFRHEAEVLGSLQHAGIAQIFEAGTFDSERGTQPFFAMEYVDGRRLTDHADAEGLDVRARLELVVAICEAAAHAHERCVTHRDLKPDNILVDAAGQVKILDFGIAKMTEGDAAATQYTLAGTIVGTLAYMSPEQLGGQADGAGVRSDVYALGVICYELLTRRLPHDLTGKPIAEAARIVTDEDARRLGEVDPALRGDVETIVAKALEKDRTRRYPSAAELGNDIRRHLADEPILARRPSTFYQLQKLARRNRGLVAGAIASLVILIAGTIVATVFAFREARQRVSADRQAYRSLLSGASMALDLGRPSIARAQIEQASPALRSWEWDHLKARVIQQRQIEVGQPLVGSLVFTPRGEYVMSALDDGSVAIVHFATGEHAAKLRVPGARLTTVGSDTPDERIAAGAEDGRVFVWPSWRAMSEPEVVIRHETPVQSVAWSADGSTLVSSGCRTVRAWTGAEPRIVDRLHEKTTYCRDLTVSPGGDRVAAVLSEPKRVRLWDLERGGHADYRNSYRPMCVAFGPAGGQLAIGHYYQPIHVVDGRTLEFLHVPGGHNRAVTGVAWSADGTRLVTTSSDAATQLWDADAWRPSAVLRHEVTSRAPATSPDGRHAVYCLTGASAISVWSLSGHRSTTIQAHERNVENLIWAHAGSVVGPLLASRSLADPKIRLWDPDTGEQVAEFVLPGKALRHSGTDLAFSPDGREVYAGWHSDAASGVFVFDLVTGARTLDREGGKAAPRLFQGAMRHRCRRFSRTHVQTRDGFTVKAVDRTCYLGVVPIDKFAAHVNESEIQAVALSPDERTVVFTDDGGVMHFHGVGTFEEVRPPVRHDNIDSCVDWSVDGTRIVTGSRNGVIRTWDAVTGDLMFEMVAHEREIWALSFSPDGTRLASGGRRGRVEIWDTVPRSQREREAWEARQRRDAERPRVLAMLEEHGDAATVRDLLLDELADEPLRRQAALRVLLEQATRGGR